MASMNRTLARFDLVGIPPAPRGVPQIEVTFDIDANGILHVSAKDLGTGKEQKIRIESSSGLKEEEIQRMVREAEEHAEEDRRMKEAAEARNEADSLIYNTEKTLREFGDKVSSEDRKRIEAAISDLRSVMDSRDAAKIREKTEVLKQAAFRISEEVYRQAQQRSGGSTGSSQSSGSSGTKTSTKSNVEDVDYEVVDDDKK